jgi:hypothetical protein
LLSRELTSAEQVSFLTTMCTRLRLLADELRAGQYTIVGQSPANDDVLERMQTWLATHERRSIANSPRAED